MVIHSCNKLFRFFSDQVILGQGLQEVEAPAIGETARMLVGAPDGVPLAVMENYLTQDFTDLTAEALTGRGLYQLLRARGTQIRVAQQRIGARAATAEESRLLEIKRNGPVLTMDRTAYDTFGKAVEYGHHCYRPDNYAFEITLVDN